MKKKAANIDRELKELASEAFVDGWLKGFDAARRLLSVSGGTLDAPPYGCTNDSEAAYDRARERIRKRKYPKLTMAAMKDFTGGGG